MIPHIAFGNVLLATEIAPAQSQVMPLVFAALLLDAAIVAGWYMAGSLLNNDKVKGAAKGEAYQLVGTGILMMIVIGVLIMFGTLFFNLLGTTQLMSPATIGTLCHNIVSTTQLNVIGYNSIMSAPTTQSAQFKGLCDIVHSSAGTLPSITDQINYPLAATGVIIANLTNQTAANLDSAFVFDAFVGFLQSLSPTFGVHPLMGAKIAITYKFSPFAGYDELLSNLRMMGIWLTAGLEAFIAQLNVIMIGLYLWPYLIFIGIVMRATPFTRPIGGLLIAAAIVLVLVLPTIYAIEYLSLASSTANGATAYSAQGEAYGFNPVTTLPGNDIVMCPGQGATAACTNGAQPTCALTQKGFIPTCGSIGGSTPSPTCGTGNPGPTCNYSLNFFVEPNVKGIVQTGGCWQDSITSAEVEDAAFLMIPFSAVISTIVSGVFSGVPDLALPATCNYGNAIKTFFWLIHASGIMGISMYLLPFLNIMMVLTALTGLSGVLGGDTELAGLAKLIP